MWRLLGLDSSSSHAGQLWARPGHRGARTYFKRADAQALAKQLRLVPGGYGRRKRGKPGSDEEEYGLRLSACVCDAQLTLG